MADQALHGPAREGPARRRPARPGREASAAIAGSVAFHALMLGYLALLGLPDADDGRTGPVSEPTFPYSGIPVELVPFPAGEGRRLRPGRVAPVDGARPMTRAAERSPDVRPPGPGRLPGRQTASPTSTPHTEPGAGMSAPPVARPGVRGDRLAPFAGPPRTSTLACRTLAGGLTFEEQAVCDERFGRAAARARPIRGTDNPVRDARFAAEGQAELDAYEALRAPLKPPTPCEGADMMGRCPALIMIPLFSRKF